MRTLILATMVLLPSSALLAQGAQEQYDKLVAEYQAEVQKVSAAQRAVMQSEAYIKAREARDIAAANALMLAVPQPPVAEYVARAQKAAKAFAGTEGAVPFLSWVVQNGRTDRDAIRGAIHTLVTDHIESDKLVALASTIGRMGASLSADEVEKIEQRLLAEGHTQVKAAINEVRARAAERAAGQKFMKERLQIGMVAPDIEAPDLDGVNFKLSDYRGKVVVIDFWGDW